MKMHILLLHGLMVTATVILPSHMYATSSVATVPQEENNEIILDTIRAVCFTDKGPNVITQSDLDRPQVDGTVTQLDDLITRPLICQEASLNHVEQDDEMVDKYLEQAQRANNLTRAEMEQVLKDAGYTYQEAREQIGQLMQINSFFGFKFGPGRIVISDEEIAAYDNQHPEFEVDKFYIQRALISETDAQKNAVYWEKNANWSTPFWITQEETATEKHYIFDLKEKEISVPHPVEEGGYEIFKMVQIQQARRVPLETRRSQIINMLFRKRFKEEVERYKNELKEKAALFIPSSSEAI
jgi:parvulin-like peptidyl-prolyl isomerase